MAREARLLLTALCLSAALSGCSEEDRRAWVSILPMTSAGEDTTAVADGPRDLAIAADSAAVLLGPDTLFTTVRVPGRPPIVEVVPSPDSTSIAFVGGADRDVVGVWSRRRQVAGIAEEFPGGGAASPSWSPDGRYLAYSGTAVSGVSRVGVFDGLEFRARTHPLLSWLSRQRKASWPQGWIDESRLRLLVAPGSEPSGGLAYSWELDGGAFMLEADIEPLAERAPPGTRLERGGVVSLDLLGDAAPETLALFRTPDGAPGALVLERRGTGYRATPTVPLLAAEALGLESWQPARRGAALHQIATLGGRTSLLFDLPSSSTLRAIGIFQASAAGVLEPMTVAGEGGSRPAIFYDGIFGDVTSQLGLVDLDGDGGFEVVSAVGRVDAGSLEPGLQWTVAPFRARDGRLIPAPDLEAAALETVQRAVGGS